MIFVMALIGAITRLTESGLSIMEWAPFRGTLPPFSETEWVRLFGLYQATDEFKVDNFTMDLAGFKSIFWWEWIHRFWGRAMGLYFGLGLIFFWVRRGLPGWLKPHLLFALVLGGLQGTVGWFMVASGFDDGLTDVSHFRLAAHLAFALILYTYLFVLALKLGWPRKGAHISPPYIRTLSWIGLTCLIITLFSGALVAGLNAGLIYAEWPLMGGDLVPFDYFLTDTASWVQTALNHDTAVQFNHRWFAVAFGIYTLCIAIMVIRNCRSMASAKFWSALLIFIVIFQVLLGISTLVLSVPTMLGAAHQGGAITLLTAYVATIYFLRRQAYKI